VTACAQKEKEKGRSLLTVAPEREKKKRRRGAPLLFREAGGEECLASRPKKGGGYWSRGEGRGATVTVAGRKPRGKEVGRPYSA